KLRSMTPPEDVSAVMVSCMVMPFERVPDRGAPGDLQLSRDRAREGAHPWGCGVHGAHLLDKVTTGLTLPGAILAPQGPVGVCTTGCFAGSRRSFSARDGGGCASDVAQRYA